MASARTTLPARLLSAARTVHDSTGFERAARAGFAVNGLLHVLMGVLAISVATGAGNAGDDADPAGAIHAIADTPGGFVLVWVIAAGLACLALWLLLESVLGHLVRGEVRSGLLVAAKAVAYGALAVPAVTIGLGGRVESDDDVREISAFLVQTPSGSVGKAVTVLGTVGYIAKGVALTAVGVLLIITAVTVDPAEAAGLDGALRSVAELPFGAALLVLIGLGLIAYGLYCGVRARRATL